MELTSGIEVELRRITLSERITAKSASKTGMQKDGGEITYVILDAPKSEYEYVRSGVKNIIGLKFFKTTKVDGREYATDETLVQLSEDDFIEISIAVQKENNLGDYEAKK